MCCGGLHSLANPACSEGFPFYALPSVAPYCAPGGVRVVSSNREPRAGTGTGRSQEKPASRVPSRWRREASSCVLEEGIGDALAYLSFPGSHHARLRTTHVLERLVKEVKRRTRVVGVFPNETSASALATEIVLRSSEEWALRRYLTMDALDEAENLNPQNLRR